MKLISGVFRINDTLYDFCGIYEAFFFWGGGMFFLKGLILTASRILIFIKMQLDERYTGELRGLLLERSFSFGKKFIW